MSVVGKIVKSRGRFVFYYGVSFGEQGLFIQLPKLVKKQMNC